jgi:hypothetical protein
VHLEASTRARRVVARKEELGDPEAKSVRPDERSIRTLAKSPSFTTSRPPTAAATSQREPGCRRVFPPPSRTIRRNGVAVKPPRLASDEAGHDPEELRLGLVLPDPVREPRLVLGGRPRAERRAGADHRRLVSPVARPQAPVGRPNGAVMVEAGTRSCPVPRTSRVANPANGRSRRLASGPTTSTPTSREVSAPPGTRAG